MQDAASQQMAAIQQMLAAAGAAPTAENYNRASLHMARGDDNAQSPLFEQAMARVMAAPKPRQVRQAGSQANAPLPLPPPEAPEAPIADTTASISDPGGSVSTATNTAVSGVDPARMASISDPGGSVTSTTNTVVPRQKPGTPPAQPTQIDPEVARQSAEAGVDPSLVQQILPYIAAVAAKKPMRGGLPPGSVNPPPSTGGQPLIPGGSPGAMANPASGAPAIAAPPLRLADPNPPMPALGPGHQMHNLQDTRTGQLSYSETPSVIPQPGIINMPTPPGGTNAVVSRRLAEYDAGNSAASPDKPIASVLAERAKRARTKKSKSSGAEQ